MKKYSEPIIYFTIRCPKDGIVKRALIKTTRTVQGERFPLPSECHGALYETETCKKCQAYCTLMFFHGEEPDVLFNNPIVPILDKHW